MTSLSHRSRIVLAGLGVWLCGACTSGTPAAPDPGDSLPDPVVVTTQELPQATVGEPYGTQLQASGGNGVSYTWSVVSGSLPPGLTLSASGSLAGVPQTEGTWAFGVLAQSGGAEGTANLSLTVVPASPAGYQIEMIYLTPLSGAALAAFESARLRWESIITGDLPDYIGDLDACDDRHPARPGGVDDLVVYVSVDSIDGSGGAVGQAGPCYLRDGDLPLTGVMTFDSADLAFLDANGLLMPTVLHEMGHVLGIGTLWSRMDLLSGDCLVDPAFTGTGARAAFDAAGGTAYVGGAKVPVENGGALDDGSNCVHWRESVLNQELMTPSLDRSAHPLSAVTVRSLEDQGYTIDTERADAYEWTAPGSVGVGSRDRVGGVLLRNDVLSIARRTLPLGGWMERRP